MQEFRINRVKILQKNIERKQKFLHFKWSLSSFRGRERAPTHHFAGPQVRLAPPATPAAVAFLLARRDSPADVYSSPRLRLCLLLQISR
ncbi:hypothetical protein BS78_K186400 [Paspalum vaginatum]|uniref:Uncharacterized protein n=1 Tax=Paspalum vaginatum TaxID=158149 RepID=A0A9W7X808_9POAL|nr:hypothetical protein BS78_K186400 [Paspalum vaginatum]